MFAKRANGNFPAIACTYSVTQKQTMRSGLELMITFNKETMTHTVFATRMATNKSTKKDKKYAYPFACVTVF